MDKTGLVTIHGGKGGDTSTLEINYYVKRICEAYAKVYILEEVCRIHRESPMWKFMIEPNSPSVNPSAIAQKKSRDKSSYASAPIRMPSRGIKTAARALPGKAALRPGYADIAKRARTDIAADLYPVDIGRIKPPAGDLKTHQFDLQDGFESEHFFEHFRKLQRPVVYFVPKLEPPVLLFDHFGKDALRLKALRFNSPFETAFNGIVGLIELLLNQDMQREAHELEKKLKTTDLNLKTLELAEKIVNIYRLMEDPATPYPMKQFLIQTLVGIIDQQAKLNGNMGIARVDFEGRGSLDIRV